MQSADKSLGQIDDSIAQIQHPHGYLIMCFHLEYVFFLRVASAILSVKCSLSNIKRTFRKTFFQRVNSQLFLNKCLSDV